MDMEESRKTVVGRDKRWIERRCTRMKREEKSGEEKRGDG